MQGLEEMDLDDLDKDHSGNISLRELRTHMRSKNPSVTEEQVAQFFNELDNDKSGTVSRKEISRKKLLSKKFAPPADERFNFDEMAEVKAEAGGSQSEQEEESSSDFDSTDISDEETPGFLAMANEGRDPFTAQTLDIISDESGKNDVILMIHKVCYTNEVELDTNEETSDLTGRYAYLLACRTNKISGKYMLLKHTGLKQRDLVTLSAALPLNSSLTHLDFSHNSVGDEGASALASALVYNNTIRTVTLATSHIGWQGGEAFGETLEKNGSITHLDLQKNQLGDRACSTIIKALKSNVSLLTLNLADNKLGMKSSRELRETLGFNCTLMNLDLSWNHIRPQDLSDLAEGLKSNHTLKTLSLSWNGIGDKTVEPDVGGDMALSQTQKTGQTQKTAASSRPSTLRPVTTGGRGGGVEAMVALIQENEGITDLDISNCRLGPNICKDLAKAIKENVTLRYILLDGNPFGDGAVDILRVCKERMLDGSLSKFRMDNCNFDATKRNIEFDEAAPNGYYRLDLSDPVERNIWKMLQKECKERKKDICRNERLDGKKLSLTCKLLSGGYDGNWKGWEAPAQGILEVDIVVTNTADASSQTIHPQDFNVLTKTMEMSGNDRNKMAVLKQALSAYHFDCNQAMMVLLQFAVDSSREVALIMMFTSMTDRKNLFLCHAALSDRSKFNLMKRLGPLYMINRTDPGGRYWFDLSKSDDQKALRMLQQIEKVDRNAYFYDVLYAEMCEKEEEGKMVFKQQPVEVLQGSEMWYRIFNEESNVVPGTPEEIIDHGILECKLKAERKGLTLASSLSKYVKRTRAEPSRGRGTSTAQWGSDKHSLSKTLPGQQKHEPNVMTFDSRPPTAAAEGI